MRSTKGKAKPSLESEQRKSALTPPALTMNNTDLMVTFGFAGEVLEPGATAVPAEALSKLIDALPDDADISITVHGTTACLASGRRRFRLMTFVADALPPDLV